MSIWRWLKAHFIPLHIFLGIVFLMSGFIVCFLMLLTMIFVLPFNKTLYRKIVYLLAYSHWSQFTFLGQWWSKSEPTLILHNENDMDFMGREHSVVVMNHKYDIDWLLAWLLAERTQMLGGTKVFTKSTLKFMPLLGWAWYFAESIFLHRDWEKDKEILSSNLANLQDYPDPYWFTFLLFCEGTRFTPAKHKLSMKFAKEHNLPILKHHLSPRTRGFVAIIQGLRGKVPAIFDMTIVFTKDSAPPNMMSILQGKDCKATIYAKRILLDEIPADDEKCAAWLQEHYKFKDQLYDHFMEHGRFPGGFKFKLHKRYNDLLTWCFWAFLTGLPTAYLFFSFIMYGSLFMQILSLVILVLGTTCVMKLIAISEINTTSSSYGKEAKNK